MKQSALLVLSILTLIGCGTEGSSSLSVVVAGEETISEGLTPGSEEESINDGWTVLFDRYVATIGKPTLGNAAGETFQDPKMLVVDLTQLSESGTPLFTVDGLAGERYSFGYRVGADAAATKTDLVNQADYDRQIAEGFSYQVAGMLMKADGQSCPPASLSSTDKTPNGNMNANGDPCYDAPSVSFAMDFTESGDFGPCEIDEQEGVAIPEEGTQTASIVLHGDHLFFNGFVEDEDSVMRLAQFLADCDLNLDGMVTEAELMMIAPSDLAEFDSRYELASNPISKPLTTMMDYLSAQVATQGHFQGEGECAYTEL